MARKSRDEYVETLEKQVRELKGVNRQLTRRLRKIDKQFRETLELEEEELKVKRPKTPEKDPDCPKCLKGILQEIVLGTKVLRTCNCGYRKTENI